MRHPNSVTGRIYTDSTETGIQSVETDPAFIANIAETLKAGEGAYLPENLPGCHPVGSLGALGS